MQTSDPQTTPPEQQKYPFNPFWNHRQRRLRLFWRVLLFFLVFVSLTLGGGVLIATLLAVFGGNQAADQVQRAPGPLLLLGFSFFTTFATVASMGLAALALDRRPLSDYGLRLNSEWWRDCGFGLVLGAVLMGGIFLVELAAGWVTITRTWQAPADGPPFALAILVPLLVFLNVGIYEEMLTRGYLLRNLAEGLPNRWISARAAIIIAWVVSSSLFALGHAANPNASAISTTLLVLAGLMLGLGYVLTGNLGIPIGLHISWNFFQGNVFGFPVSGGDFSQATFMAIEQGGPVFWTGGAFGPEAGMLGVLAVLAGSLLTVGWVHLSRGRVGLYLPLAQLPEQRATTSAAQA